MHDSVFSTKSRLVAAVASAGKYQAFVAVTTWCGEDKRNAIQEFKCSQ